MYGIMYRIPFKISAIRLIRISCTFQILIMALQISKKYLKGKNRKRIKQEQKPLKKVFKCIGNVVNVKVFESNYKKASNSGN